MELLLWQSPAGGPSPWLNLVFIGAMLVVVYFFMIRPQQTQRKKHKEFVLGLKRGESVVTIGGLHGVIIDVTDTTVTIVPEKGSNVKMTFQKESISQEMSAAANLGKTNS
jgi:preprotein translocase subunit YajC